MPPKKENAQTKKIAAIFDGLATRWPNAHCELVHNTPFQLLLAVVLSAQATDVSVNKALKPVIEAHPQFGPQDVVDLGVSRFLKLIRSIGLAPTKAKNSVALSNILLEHHQGKVPHSREALEALPGVGRKTANVVLNVLWDEPTMPVDTHVARVSKRLGLAREEDSVLVVEQKLLKIIPLEHRQRAHHRLIFHGRYLCLARGPKCGECPLSAYCDFFKSLKLQNN